MKDPKSTIRYMGFQALSDGGRRFDFSFTRPDASQQSISVKAASELFFGPNHMAIQECAAICMATLKARVLGAVVTVPSSIKLTSDDVALHRKPGKAAGRRRA
jgi:hypothetical protein